MLALSWSRCPCTEAAVQRDHTICKYWCISGNVRNKSISFANKCFTFMNHFEIKLALRVSDIIQSSSKWVFISGSRQMEGRNTHGMDHQSNSSFAAPPNIQLATKVIKRGCVGSHAVIAQPSAKVTADPSRRQIVVTW